MKHIFYMRIFRCFALFLVFWLFYFFAATFFEKSIMLLLAFLVMLYYWKDILEITSKEKVVFVVFVVLALISAFFIYKKHNFEDQHILSDTSGKYKILVIRSSVLHDDYNVTLGKILNEGSLKNKYVLIRSDIHQTYDISQKLLVDTHLEISKNQSVPFDFFFFGKVFYQINFKNIELLEDKSKSNVFAVVDVVRKKVSNNMKQIFDLEVYNLASMWLLGKTNVVDKSINDVFSNVGINHILVVSGTHLSVLFSVVLYGLVFLPGLPVLGSFVASVLVLVLFLMLTGFSASIFRAALMWFFILLAKYNGVLVNYTNILILVVAIVAVSNPLTLIYDVGFHLSFLSVASLFYIFPIVNFYYQKLNIKEGSLFDLIMYVLLASTSIFVGLFAYILYVFKEFNFLSVFLNVVLIPLASVCLALVFLATMVGFVSLFLAKAIGLLASMSIKFFLVLVDSFEKISFQNNILMFNFSLVVIVYYVFVVFLIIDFYKKNPKLTFNI